MLGWDGWDLRNQTEEPSTAETWQEQGRHEQNKGILFIYLFIYNCVFSVVETDLLKFWGNYTRLSNHWMYFS